MQHPVVIYNGEEVESAQPLLATVNAVCQDIHTLDRQALHLDAHIQIACAAFSRLYWTAVKLDAAKVARDITKLLERNAFPPRGSALVRIMLTPNPVNAGSGVNVLLVPCGRLLYAGYRLWHTRLRAVMTPYDCFPAAEPCLTAILNAAYAQGYAHEEGVDVALHTTGGMLVGMNGGLWCGDAQGVANGSGVSEHPLFCTRDGLVSTSSLEAGAIDSVWRRLGMKALSKAGQRIAERSVGENEIGDFDEIFSITPQGPVSLLACGKKMYFNTLVVRIADILPQLSAQPLTE